MNQTNSIIEFLAVNSQWIAYAGFVFALLDYGLDFFFRKTYNQKELLISAFSIVLGLTIGSFLFKYVFLGARYFSDNSIINIFNFSGAIVLQILVFDFVTYLGHLISHRVNFFWRFHSVHHTSKQISALATYRQTPLKIFMPEVFIWYVLFYLGYPLTTFVAMFFVFNFWNLFLHCSWISFPKWANKILISPAHHILHHQSEIEMQNKNYGGFFSVWDRLFKTYQEPVLVENVTYGLDNKVNSINLMFGDVSLKKG